MLARVGVNAQTGVGYVVAGQEKRFLDQARLSDQYGRSCVFGLVGVQWIEVGAGCVLIYGGGISAVDPVFLVRQGWVESPKMIYWNPNIAQAQEFGLASPGENPMMCCNLSIVPL